MRLIGIHGPVASGKDTAADILISAAGPGALRRAYADPLYIEVAQAFGVTVSFLQARDTKEMPLSELSFSRCQDGAFLNEIGWCPTCGDWRRNIGSKSCITCFDHLVRNDRPNSPRRILQLWGTEYRRFYAPRYWLNEMNRFLYKNAAAPLVVVPDVRFQNEADHIHLLGGDVWHILRPGCGAVNSHASEVRLQLGEDDAVIHNDGTIEAFAEKLLTLLKLRTDIGPLILNDVVSEITTVG